MQKLGTKVMSCFLIVFSVLFTYILGSTVFYNQSRFPIDIPMPFLFILALLLAVILYFVYHFLEKWNPKWDRKYIFAGMFIIFIIFQAILAYYLAVKPGWDFGSVYQAVVNDINGKTKIYQDYYFYAFQNNVALAYLLKVFFLGFKLFGCTNYVLAGIIFNMLCIDISIYFIYKTISILFEKKNHIFFFLLLFATLPFIAMTPIFYTDSIVLPFVSIPLYLFIYLIKNKELTEKKKYILYGVIGVLCAIGLQIKVTAIIVLIAYLGYLLLATDIKKSVKGLLVLFGAILLVTIPIKFAVNRLFDKTGLDNSEVPLTHWIMMGLTGDGSFNYEDYSMTFTAGNYKAKKEKNISVIKQRLKNHINHGTLGSFYTKKLSFVWSDGTYYTPELLSITPIRKNALHTVVISSADYFDIYYGINQTQHFLMLTMILLSIFCARGLDEDMKKVRNFLLITIFGIILFFVIWESSPRYLFHMLPVLMIASYIGMTGWFQFLNESVYQRFFGKKEVEK